MCVLGGFPIYILFSYLNVSQLDKKVKEEEKDFVSKYLESESPKVHEGFLTD